MPYVRILDPSASPLAFFGAEVRRARERHDRMSQAQLAQICHCDPSVVSRVESNESNPPEGFAEGCDKAFPEMDGWFTRFAMRYRFWADGIIPRWFEDWLSHEQKANLLRIWHPLIVPGLFQTADYIRALWERDQPEASAETIEELISARLARQAIFDRSDPPHVLLVLTEYALRNLIGTPRVMHDQLIALAELSNRSFISVQVIPEGEGANTGLGGAFWIASAEGQADLLLIEAVEDQTYDSATLLRKAAVTFDRLRGDALPRSASRNLIMKVAGEEWKQPT
jgi:transcriptional regulator with XRE-family HTH domain